jgi:cytochrome c biogenesis protein CcdA
MPLFILAYLRGAMSIASPCILPVLPFVFSRAGPALLSPRLADASRHRLGLSMTRRQAKATGPM